MVNAKAVETIVVALAAYDIGDVREVVRVTGEHENRPHVVRTVAGRFFARLLAPRLGSPVALGVRHAFAEHLADHGLRVPRLLRTRSGESFARVAEEAVEVYEYIEDRVCGPEDARQAGEALADLHGAAESFRARPGGARRDWLTVNGDLARLQCLEEQMRTYLPAPEVFRSLETVREALLAAGRALAGADLPTGMIHGSFQPPNLLRDAAGELWITGFDYAHQAPLLLDVATAVLGFGEDIVAAYHDRRPLAEPERALLPSAVRRVLIHVELERGLGVERIAARLA
jgi:Ser/Thr protein kinase RdoA (MazF antagonist)